ncbi:MAG TPA: arginine--tRNA ligase [Chitinophagaceae bacterium]|nr:arginine--tRNA ligase [Chitinophagaceae bacterium]
MSVVAQIKKVTGEAIKALYNTQFDDTAIQVNATKPEFEGDYTVVLFGFIKQLKKAPDVLGNEIGNYLLQHGDGIFTSFNVIKGFLNLVISDSYWLNFLQENYNNTLFGRAPVNGKKVMVEYSSPNTNKPLHLGHLRNNFLGWSTAAILQANGYDIIKTCIVNDRGIHICKSMIAWQLYADGATPESTGIKGDHFVGDYYVKFNDVYKQQVETLVNNGMPKEIAEKEAAIMKGAQQMLLDWEAGKPGVVELWKTMNSWVYEGFDATYKKIGSDFDRIYYESETYLLGKDLVDGGLQKGVFFQKEDGSVWIDLTADGLDEKLVRRRDGTSVYITQDIGLAVNKYQEYKYDQSIYVVGDEQIYHFKVLKLICQKLGLPSADGIYHLSYGMVELPGGKMKSREGTVVDADDIIAEMVSIARQKTEELGKVKDFAEEDLAELYNTLGLGALKFFLLRVDPKKRMVFNPEESIDFHGFTGPYIQFTYARTRSILRKLASEAMELTGITGETLLELEKAVLKELEQFPVIIDDSSREHDPSKIAIYIFNLSKTFTAFLTEHSIMTAESQDKKVLRARLAQLTAQTIHTGMGLLGIKVPERM